jgi:hypothetical protein
MQVQSMMYLVSKAAEGKAVEAPRVGMCETIRISRQRTIAHFETALSIYLSTAST